MAELRFPLPFKGSFVMTQGFGERPKFYRERVGLPGHNGIDWSMPVGTAILAVDPGRVVLVDDTPDGFGVHLKLEHTWGQSLYAHLSRTDLAVGQQAKKGQQLGLSGNTGLSSGPHLHFGVRVNPYENDDGWNGYTNPQRFLNWPAAGAAANTTALEQQLAAAKQTLAELQGEIEFERQELTQQAELWREAVTNLLRRHMPGQLPTNADVLTTLEALIASWSQELQIARAQRLASFEAPQTAAP